MAAVSVCVAATVQFPGGAYAASNLVRNGTFASSVTGWTASTGGSLALAAAKSGTGHSARVSNSSTGSKTLVLNDEVNTVSSTTVGASYTAGAWVRSSVKNQSMGIRVMEYGANKLKGQAQSTVWATDTAWHYVTVTYVAKTAGSSLDLNVLAWSLPAKEAFETSEVELTMTSGAGVANPPPPSPSSSATAPAPSPSTTAPSGWKVSWSDEFDGSSVNGSKWNVRNNDYATNQLSISTNRSTNVKQHDGVLDLTAQRENISVGSTKRNYSSGYLDTIGKFSQQYGRFAVRAKLPTNQGMWPAFWLRTDRGLGELDVFEAIGGLNEIVHTAHESTNGGGGRVTVAYPFPAGFSTTDWHTYAVEWSKDSISWYVDSALVKTFSPSTAPWMTSAFNGPMNIRMNLQVGGSMAEYFKKPVTSSTPFPATYQIDWVRVYSR